METNIQEWGKHLILVMLDKMFYYDNSLDEKKFICDECKKEKVFSFISNISPAVISAHLICDDCFNINKNTDE